MKISPSLFFTRKKYKYLKRTENFLFKNGTHKINIKGFRKKITEHFYGSWSLKNEKVQGGEALAMKIISLDFLYSVFKSPIFSEMLISKKNADILL